MDATVANILKNAAADFVPVPSSHPDHLAVAGALRGLRVARPDVARVLEIACGDGSNILPMAFYMPRARFVGLDASARHIAIATEAVEHLRLENVEFIEGDGTGLAGEGRRFDYIIVNGVFSLTTDEGRRDILRRCGELLDPEGIAYISYNTRVGWSYRGQLRSVVRRHARKFDSLEAKLAAIRELLEALDVEWTDMNNPFNRLSRYEVVFARSLDDRELLQVFLSPEIRSFSFSEFSDLAGAEGLVAFDEVQSPSSQRGQDLEFRHTLFQLLQDEVATEEAAEFVTCPQFRETLLCHEAALANASPSLSAALSLGEVAAPLASRHPEVLLDEGMEVAFSTSMGHLIRAEAPANKAVLAVLMNAWPEGRAFEALVSEAETLLQEQIPDWPDLDADALAGLAQELLAMRTMGVVSFRTPTRAVATTIPEKPEVFDLCVWQAGRGLMLTNGQHTLVTINEFSRQMVLLMDGTRDREALVAELLGKFAAGELILNEEEEGGTEDLETLIPKLVDEALTSFVRMGLLADF